MNEIQEAGNSDRAATGIVGSNPTQGMAVSTRLSVLCCPV
jgi:hypothetical protein